MDDKEIDLRKSEKQLRLPEPAYSPPLFSVSKRTGRAGSYWPRRGFNHPWSAC